MAISETLPRHVRKFKRFWNNRFELRKRWGTACPGCPEREEWEDSGKAIRNPLEAITTWNSPKDDVEPEGVTPIEVGRARKETVSRKRKIKGLIIGTRTIKTQTRAVKTLGRTSQTRTWERAQGWTKTLRNGTSWKTKIIRRRTIEKKKADARTAGRRIKSKRARQACSYRSNEE